MKAGHLLYIGVALIGAALFAVRQLSPEFRPGTTTAEHPYLLFAGLLMGANLIWLFFIPLLKRMEPGRVFWGLLGISLLYRALFFGSVPIYEDDWNRYLWDGAMIVQGEDPYGVSPAQIYENPDYAALKDYSASHDHLARKINNAHLTTIYPPMAQSAFALAHIIKPADKDALRFVYLLTEVVTLLLLVKVLPQFGRSRNWALLYGFSPLLIYSAFNVLHMDILLPPLILLVLWAVKTRPFWAGAALAGAAAVKIWPLILAPVLYREHLKRPVVYVGCAFLIAVLSAVFLFPMVRHLGTDSGLQAYSGEWERSSFLFPHLKTGLSFLAEDAGRAARIFVAAIVTGISLFFGFASKQNRPDDMPAKLMIVTLALLLLSPTGFPWYAIWIIMLMPFVPLYGAALICVLVPLYYVRFALGEQGVYHIYRNVLTPVQFGIPLLVLAIELLRRRRHV